MKKYIILLIVLAGGLLNSCNESDFLREKPKDFMSGNNSFITEADFDMSINELYYLVRLEFFGRDEFYPFDYLFGTDLVFDGEPASIHRHSNMSAAYHPTSAVVKSHWDAFYLIIAQANTVISRLPSSALTPEQQKMFEAKARFFRGLSYRSLVYLYGGVPVVLEEVTSPKTDYVRESKENTLKQAIEDVKYAAENLKDIAAVQDGEISSAAAYHLLSELYIAAGQYQEAVNAANRVIDNPTLKLMQNRFGTRATEQPGDVYWDLFRKNNQNRGSGNTEGIWVIQFEVNLPGGGSSTSDVKAPGNFQLERHHAPMVRDVRLNGKSPFRWPIGDYTGGRGIGWAPSTRYFTNTIWESDFDNDIRNANHNFVRKFPVTNPDFKSEFGIDSISTENPPQGMITGMSNSTQVPGRYFYAYQTKCTTPYNHPAEVYDNPAIFSLKSTAGVTFTDQYLFRFAETYLLRAEAYLMTNESAKAAEDINMVRTRANAKSITAGEVTLDYILDERMRELGIEEKRRLTLMRMGKLYDRVKKCNPYYANAETNGDGVGMLEKYNVWPIPHSVIEANSDAVLEQNTGY